MLILRTGSIPCSQTGAANRQTMKWIGRRDRCCCGCSVKLGSQILATMSAIIAAIAMFTSFFSGMNWITMLAEIFYCFAAICAAGLVFRAIRSRRAILMAPQMLVAIINVVALVITFIVCILTGFGVNTIINDNVNSAYNYHGWFYNDVTKYMQYYGIGSDDVDKVLQEYAETAGWSGSFSSFFIAIFGIWVFIVFFDCFRTIKAGEGQYPTAQYHGNDNITVPIYPTYPAPSYDAAAAAARSNPAPAYSADPLDIPPAYANSATTTTSNTPYSFTNPTVTTADETPVKVPLP